MGLGEVDAIGGKALALTTIEGVLAAVGGRITIHLIGHLSAAVGVFDSAVAQNVGSVTNLRHLSHTGNGLRGSGLERASHRHNRQSALAAENLLEGDDTGRHGNGKAAIVLSGQHGLESLRLGGSIASLEGLVGGGSDRTEGIGLAVHGDGVASRASSADGDGICTQYLRGGDGFHGRHGVINQNGTAIQRTDCQFALDAVLVGVLHVRQQLDVLKTSSNRGVHDGEAERALVVAAGTLHSGVQGGTVHQTQNALGVGHARDIVGVLTDKLQALGVLHGEDTSQNLDDGGLIDFLPILADLSSDIGKRILTTGDVVGEIALSPCLCAADDNTGMGEGLSAGGGDVGRTIVVLRGGTADDAAQRNGDKVATDLIAHGLRDVLTLFDGAGLNQLVAVQVGNAVNILLEHVTVEVFGIEDCHVVMPPVEFLGVRRV